MHFERSIMSKSHRSNILRSHLIIVVSQEHELFRLITWERIISFLQLQVSFWEYKIILLFKFRDKFFFFLFRTASSTYGTSQARGSPRSCSCQPTPTTATVTQDLSHICDLHCSSQQRRILNPLSRGRDWTCILMDSSWACNCWATLGTPRDRVFKCPPTYFSTAQYEHWMKDHHMWCRVMFLKFDS